MKFKTLSIVHPNGTKIARGEKTIEVRSWQPPENFNEDLLIVENKKFLCSDGEVDPEGTPAACASRWEPGYYSWELTDVRPINSLTQVLAARGIYEVELDLT